MEIAVHTRHLDIADQLREAAVEKARHLERFLEGSQRAEILFSQGPRGARRRLRLVRGPGRRPRPLRARQGERRTWPRTRWRRR